MILAIDCGNTHVTLGCVRADGTVASVARIPTDHAETDCGYAVKLKETLALYDIRPEDLHGAALSCVVPPMTAILVQAVRLLTGLETLVVGAGIKTGLHICINDPGTIASDLVVTAVAAKETYPLPCIIVDLGTATTVTVLDQSARFLGGAILPGAGLSLEALSKHTALLPHVEIQPPKHVIASGTADCMRSGIVYGTAGAVDGMLDRFSRELGQEPATIVATGGIAPLIYSHCRHSVTLDETLALRGLWIIWNKNIRRAVGTAEP